MPHHPLSDKATPMVTQNLWLLSATGHMVSHDSLADEIILQPFDARHLPGLVMCLNEPLSCPLSIDKNLNPLKARFHKRISLPFPLPESELIATDHGLITLRNTETNRHWLTIADGKTSLEFTATNEEEASHFLPLTLESFKGLARLITKEQAELFSVNLHPTGPAQFLVEHPFHITIGDKTIALSHNLAELTRLGQLSPEQDDVITLQKDDNPALAYTFIIRVHA